jgi:uncharacterized protein YqgC (DUF456 family)
MKTVNSREFMYIGAVILLPIALLFKGMYLYFVGALVVSTLLIFFDPVFKRFRIQVIGADKFILYTFFSGGIVGLVIHFLPDLATALISVWFGINLFYGVKIGKKIDSDNESTNGS